jgi:hypothetical protein
MLFNTVGHMLNTNSCGDHKIVTKWMGGIIPDCPGVKRTTYWRCAHFLLRSRKSQ